jgi:hypothetical protein
MQSIPESRIFDEPTALHNVAPLALVARVRSGSVAPWLLCRLPEYSGRAANVRGEKVPSRLLRRSKRQPYSICCTSIVASRWRPAVRWAA